MRAGQAQAPIDSARPEGSGAIHRRTPGFCPQIPLESWTKLRRIRTNRTDLAAYSILARVSIPLERASRNPASKLLFLGRSLFYPLVKGVDPRIRLLLEYLGSFRLTLSFSVSYLLVSLIYPYIASSMLGNEAVFATAPMNPLENAAPLYGSLSAGLQSNFVFVAFLIMLCEGYSRFVHKNREWLCSVDAAFLMSLAATYSVSGLLWIFTGTPGEGTSIIGFSMLLFLGCSAFIDLPHFAFRGPEQVTKSKTTILSFLLWFEALLICPFLSVIVYVLVSPSADLHLLGAAVFATGLSIFISVRNSFHRGTRLAKEGKMGPWSLSS